MMGEPTRAVEREFAELLGYATIRSRAKDLFLSVPAGLINVASRSRLDPETKAMVKYMHRLIHNAFQRVTLKVRFFFFRAWARELVYQRGRPFTVVCVGVERARIMACLCIKLFSLLSPSHGRARNICTAEVSNISRHLTNVSVCRS